MTKLRALWAGDLPLGETFWTWAIGMGVLVNLITSGLFLTLITLDRPFAALLVGYGLSVPYNLLALVGVWRSAARHPGKEADIARVVTVLVMVLLTVT